MPGDEIKLIDCNGTQDRPLFFKQFEEETNLKTYICSIERSMAYNRSGFQLGTAVTGGCTRILLLTADAVSLTLFDTKINSY
jgi:hypothetical protein